MPVTGYSKPTMTVHAPAADTDAVVTLTAPTNGQSHKVVQVDWSYSESPTGGALTIAFGSTTYEIAVTNGGPGQLFYPDGVGNGANEAVVVTLAAGGGTVVGKLNVLSF